MVPLKLARIGEPESPRIIFFTLILVSNSILICDAGKNFIDSNARPQVNTTLTRTATGNESCIAENHPSISLI